MSINIKTWADIINYGKLPKLTKEEIENFNKFITTKKLGLVC